MSTTINDLFTSWLGGEDGIFYYLQQITGANAVPWKSENISSSLDIIYHGNHSGQKTISPLVASLLNSSGALSATNKQLLANVINDTFSVQWSKLWDTLSFDYDPIENYSMTEKHTGTDTDLKTPTNWTNTETQTPTNWTNTETQTPTNWTNTETQTPTDWKETNIKLIADNEVTDTASTYAFNSANGVPTSTNTTTTKDKNEREQSGTFETSSTQSGTFETSSTQSGTFETSSTQSGTFEDKTTYNSTLERSGNIGVTTSQQMIESERNLWQWNFFETIMRQIDSMLVIKIY